MLVKSTIQSQFRLLLSGILFSLIGFCAYAASNFTPGKPIVIITGIGFLGLVVVFTLLAIRLRFRQIVTAAGISQASIIVAKYILLFLFVYFLQDAIG